MSERQVEEGGNLDLIRRAMSEWRQQKEDQDLMRSEPAESVQQEWEENQNRMRSERLGQEQEEVAASVGALREFLVTRPVQQLPGLLFWKTFILNCMPCLFVRRPGFYRCGMPVGHLSSLDYLIWEFRFI